MILNVDFGLKLSNFTSWKGFICLKWILRICPQHCILSLTTLHSRSVPFMRTKTAVPWFWKYYTFIYLPFHQTLIHGRPSSKFSYKISHSVWYLDPGFRRSSFFGPGRKGRLLKMLQIFKNIFERLNLYTAEIFF